MLRTGVREERRVWDWLVTGTGKAQEWGQGERCWPQTEEGFWGLSGDPHAHPPGARWGPVPPTQVITFIPKCLRSCSRKIKVRTV